MDAKQNNKRNKLCFKTKTYKTLTQNKTNLTKISNKNQIKSSEELNLAM